MGLTLDNSVTFESMRPHLFDQADPEKSKANRLYAAKKSFKWFFYIYLSHYLTIEPAPFQLDEFAQCREERLLIVQPRGYGKSVKWSIGYPLWVILNNPYNKDMKWEKEDLFCISNTAALAEKWIRKHKQELTQNQRILTDYKPEPGAIWRNDEIEVRVNGKLNGRIIARGAGAQIRGEHPTEIIIDDLENREEAASEGPREKMKEYFFQDLWGALRHKRPARTRVKIVGTFVHPMALLPDLYDKDWWVKRKYAVYNPDGTPLWPAYLDDAGLQELRKQMPETAWMSEYMNAPIVSENPTFLREWFQSYEPGMLRGADGKKITLRDLYLVTAIDPAISQKDGADYTAITTYGATWDEKEPRIYCLDARRGHWPMSTQITELMAAHEKYPQAEQLIEVVAYQKALYYEYKERLEREHMNVRVVEIERDKDKGRRANVVQPLFQRGIVHFDVSDRMQQAVMDELALFDYTKRKHGRDDFVDATVDCLTRIDEWFRRRKRGTKKNKQLHIVGQSNSPVYRGVGVG